MDERTLLPHLQNGNNHNGHLPGRGAREMATVSIPDPVPGTPQRKACLPHQALDRVIIRITWTALKRQAPGLPAEESQSPGEGLESCVSTEPPPSVPTNSLCSALASRHPHPCLSSFSEGHMFKETACASEGTVGCKSPSEQRIKYLYNYIQAYI